MSLTPDQAATLADLVLYLHAGFVFFVVAGQLLILLGWRYTWEATRNPFFRWLHLAAIGYVVFGTWLGLDCPLTDWENRLRALASQAGYRRGFISDRVSSILFYETSDHVFLMLYSTFGFLVLYSFLRYPPSRRG